MISTAWGNAADGLGQRRSPTRTTMTTCSARPGRTPRTKPTPTGAASARAPAPGRDRHRRRGPATWLSDAELAGLLGPLCDATDALARLDARAAAAPDAVREGLLARMAAAEAAGWLAHAHAWVHPLDLALRDRRPHRPHRARRGRRRSPRPAADLRRSRRRRATGPIRRSRRWPRATAPSPTRWPSPGCSAGCRAHRRIRFAGATAAAATLAALGAGGLDADMFSPRGGRSTRRRRRQAPPIRQPGGEGGDPPLPPLLAGGAAPHRLDGGRHHRAPGARCTRCSPRSAWSRRAGVTARTCSCRSGRPIRPSASAIATQLPGLRSDAADRLVGRGRPVTWPLAFLHLVAESARAGAARARPARGRRGAGQGARRRRRQTVAAARRARRAAARARADAEGTRRHSSRSRRRPATALLRALQGRGVVAGGDGAGEFSRVRDLRRGAVSPAGCAAA